MNWEQLRSLSIWSMMIIAVASNANALEVSGVFGVDEAIDPLSIAVWVPLSEGQAVEGMSWYNNDATAIFPTIRAMAGDAERPDDLVYAVVVGEGVAGRSSAWSEYDFSQPIASTSAGIYVVFEVPRGGALVARGEGGGYGIGYQTGDGLIRCWISGGDTWDALAPEFQMAVVPAIALNKSSNVLTLERGQSLAGTTFHAPGDIEWPQENGIIASPNPFNPVTEIKYIVTQSAHVTLDLYDVRGRIVRHLVDAFCNQGVHSATWNGRDDGGRAVPSGTYFARFDTESERLVERLTLLR